VTNKALSFIKQVIKKEELKKYRIISDIFQNKLRKDNKVSEIVAGLVNYRIRTSITKPYKTYYKM
jgi:hypothetical protein